MLFVTGMQRCGTTLLEKLLASHPDVSLLSQPFPFLFLEAKQSFLRSIGQGDDPYPLGDLFLEGRYRLEAFTDHLSHYGIGTGLLGELFRSMADYSGQYSRFDVSDIDAAIGRLLPGDFMTTLTQLYRELGPKPYARCVGGKETTCEEFLPYFLSKGGRCVVIVRDPRDMLASLNHGRGQEFGGGLRPTVFNLRLWRKSIAFMLHLQGRKGFAWVRYEDLVSQPLDCLNRVVRALDLPDFSEGALLGGIQDQDGALWRGNSSHSLERGLNSSSVGLYRTLLADSVTAYTEAVCHPELLYLGYPVSLPWREVPRVIASFRDPYEVRENLREYGDDPRRRAEELTRVQLLVNSGSESRAYFLFDEASRLLREAVRRETGS